nr:uncharacterized protein LOC109776007 [Aegilops tauschii subsp. strangulata]
MRLPYNAILGYLALAKYMAVTHHGYNVLKMPGSGGIITVACDEKDAVCSLERAYQAAAVKNPDDEGDIRPPEAAPKRRSNSFSEALRRLGRPTIAPQDPRPLPGRLSLSHRKARLAPLSGLARGLSSGRSLT